MTGRSRRKSSAAPAGKSSSRRRRPKLTPALLARALDQAPGALFVADARGRVIYCNAEAGRLHQCTAAEVIARPLLDVLAPPDQRDVVAAFSAALRAGAAWEGDLVVRRADGGEFVAHVIATPLRDHRGATKGMIVASRDIALRKRAEDALREHQRRQATLLENLPGMAYRCRNDPQRTMEFMSSGFETIAGYAPELLISGKLSFAALMHADDRERVWREVQQAIASRGKFQLEYRLTTKSGDARWMWEQGCGVFDARGELVALEGFITDITDRRQLEAQLRHAQKMESVGLLAGGVAHDFNNLLTVILGNAAIVRAAPELPETAQENVREIAHAADRAAALTRQLLTFSRKQMMQLRALALDEVVSGLRFMLQRLLGPAIDLEIESAPALPLVRADAGMIEQVLVNLTLNARDAMPQGGRVRVQLSTIALSAEDATRMPGAHPGEFVRVTVTDTGAGIAPENLPRIFEPFFTTKEAGKGTGLGLATAYGIVQQHRGWIAVTSELGGGSTFAVHFPAATDVERAPKSSAIEAEPHGRGERVLIVEDETPLRHLLAASLRDHGYQVATAASGADALERWHEHAGEFDLLLTDVIMPGMSGRELAARLQAEQPRLRAIFCSGYSPEVIGRDFVLQTGVSFLPKPFDTARLLSTVRQVLDESAD